MSSSEHRAIVAADDMVKLNEWDTVFLDEGRGWVRRHRYSNFEVPRSAPSPPAYETPSPGNQAALAVGVNLQDIDDLSELQDFNDWYDNNVETDVLGVPIIPNFGHL
ncbi:hypothetical protein E4U41_000982 [Claviceps citrina]|nr:hypothetical protein E4U41_000982 [Claviceps citrina]